MGWNVGKVLLFYFVSIDQQPCVLLVLKARPVAQVIVFFGKAKHCPSDS